MERIKKGGRIKGTPNRTTAETKAILQRIISNELDTLPEMLAKLSTKERVNTLAKLLPFVIPRQADISIETPAHQLRPVTLTIIEETLKLESHE